MNPTLPGYEQDIESGAGLAVLTGADKVVLHTTESPRGSYNAIRNLWRGSNNWGKGLPHFLADGKKIVQLLPLDVNAYTAKNSAGGADINRAGHVIQVEICGYAKDDFDDETYEAIGKWIADLKKNGLGINVDNIKPFVGAEAGTIASVKSKYRMTASEYTAFDGICGHQHLPENDHWDPGKKDAGRLNTIIHNNLGDEEEVKSFIIWSNDGKAYQVWGLFRRHLSPSDLTLLKYLGVQDIGKNQAFLDATTEVPRGSIAGQA